MLGTETHEARLPDGRRVVCWLDHAPQAADGAPVVVLTPGFGKRMHQHSALTQYLLANGLHVLRFDSVNHLGLSDGDIDQYSLSDGLLSLEAATALCGRVFGTRDRVLIATSLSARIALRRFCADDGFAKLVAVSGVVSVRHTLNAVFDADYTAYRPDRLPPFVSFETNTVSIRQIYHDGHENDWFSLERTLEEVASLDRPAEWYVGADDEWIDPTSLRACAEANPRGCFRLKVLPNCRHDIGRNAAASRQMMIQIVEDCWGPGRRGPVVEPHYNDIVRVALEERRVQRKQKERT